MTALLPIVVSMFVLILAQSAATSRAYAMKYDDSFNENVDLIGLGLANAAAGISGTFVVNGSPTKTEMVDNAGGRSQLATLTTGLVVVVVLLFLTYWLSFMPNAVLASVVFLIGIKLVDYIGMRGIYGLRTDEFVVAAITAAVVVVVGVEQGIILAIILSLVLVLMHVYKPHDRVLAFSADGQPTMSSVGAAGPGRTRAASSTTSERSCSTPMRRGSPRRSWTSSRAPIRRSVGWRSTPRRSATWTSRAPTRSARSRTSWPARTRRLVLCAVDPAVRKLLDAYGLTDKIGAEHIFERPVDVVTAYSKLAPTAS